MVDGAPGEPGPQGNTGQLLPNVAMQTFGLLGSPPFAQHFKPPHSESLAQMALMQRPLPTGQFVSRGSKPLVTSHWITASGAQWIKAASSDSWASAGAAGGAGNAGQDSPSIPIQIFLDVGSPPLAQHLSTYVP